MQKLGMEFVKEFDNEKFQQSVRFIDISFTESRVFTKKAGIPMRTETEMFDVILQTAKVLQVDAVAMSGSRTDTKPQKR